MRGAAQLKSTPLPLDDPRLARSVSGNTPEQLRLTYYSASSVLVTWVTGEAQMGGQVRRRQKQRLSAFV